MPAIITHHLFGEDALKALPAGTIYGQEELLAFLLGNQGPDPLYARFSTFPQASRTCVKLADALHESHVVEALMAARDAVVHLPDEDRRVGRAFVLGFLCHYALDSTAHPLVYAQQEAICAANEELADRGDDVHALIEADIDSWMLWSQRGLTVNDAPTAANLAHTDRVVRVAGALIAHVASRVYDIRIGANAYGDAVSDYELIYAMIDPAPSRKTELAVKLARAVRGDEYLAAMAHYVTKEDTCPAANLDRRRWRDPHTGKPSTDSFADLYYLALERWPALSRALREGDVEALRELCGGINYNGVPEA